jgi:putative toxin-antitoxin system antitoxin component (TIGR02293 family)
MAHPKLVRNRTRSGKQSGYVALLGMQPAEPPEILRRVEAGLSFEAFEELQKNARFTAAELSGLVGIRRRTLQRRREEGRLDPDESDRLLRVTRLFSRAIELFEGDADAARDWFAAPARGLGDEKPMAMARTEIGSREVEALIDRLEQGVST